MMDEVQEELDKLPQGKPLGCLAMPVLSASHTARLRKIWSYGRPVHVADLGGVDLDLMVHGFIETVDKRHTSNAVLTVTILGVMHLNAARQTLIAAQRPHHELGRRLASHLRNKGFHTWENVEFLNPDWSAPRKWGVVRPDVFACLPALQTKNASPAIYEVKVSRADFLADLSKPGKREAYSELAEAVYYCCKDGLIDKAEMPDGFGLLCEVEQGEFMLRKKARRAKNFVLHADTALTSSRP